MTCADAKIRSKIDRMSDFLSKVDKLLGRDIFHAQIACFWHKRKSAYVQLKLVGKIDKILKRPRLQTQRQRTDFVEKRQDRLIPQ